MKFERVKGNVPVFSGEYDGRDRTIFGGAEQSNDINQQFTPEFKKGWGIVGKNEFPTLQDFNALGFTHSALIGYLYQSGVAQWVAGADYYTGSIAVQGVDLYVAIQDKPTSQPNTLQGWRLVSPALLNTTGNSTSAPMTQKAVTDALAKKWDIQTTTGSGNIARMSEVTKKADTSYVNTELGKKRDLSNSTFGSRLSVNTGSNSLHLVSDQDSNPYLMKVGWGEQKWYALPTNKGGTLALTSDIIGIDQTWKDMTSQRVAGTTYTNNTGKPIFIVVGMIGLVLDKGARASITVDSVIAEFGTYGLNGTGALSIVVPSGSKYIIKNIVNSNINKWAELRS